MMKNGLWSVAFLLVCTLGASATVWTDADLSESLTGFSIDGSSLSASNLSLNSTNVAAGSYSVQGDFTSSGGYASLQRVVPAGMTTDDINELGFSVKVDTADQDWWFTVIVYTNGYTNSTQILNMAWSGNMDDWWKGGAYEYMGFSPAWGNLSLPSGQQVDRIDVRVRYLDGSATILVDNMKIDAVPEPATMILLSLGGLLLRSKK